MKNGFHYTFSPGIWPGHTANTKSKKLSQEQAGEPFRLGQRTVSTIEQGFLGTRLDTIFRILAALDLEMVIRPKNLISNKEGDRW